jgi:hypothetical protein
MPSIKYYCVLFDHIITPLNISEQLAIVGSLY